MLLAVIVAATCSWKHIDMNSEAISSRSLDSTIRDNQKDGYEVPKIIGKGVPSQLLERFSYKTSYNKETRTPNWVGWALTSEHTDGEYARKGHSFIEDLDVPLPRAIPADIRESEWVSAWAYVSCRRQQMVLQSSKRCIPYDQHLPTEWQSQSA